MKTMFNLLVALPAALLLGGLTCAAADALDGSTFSGTVLEVGKSSGVSDHFKFNHGQFQSTACVPFGFETGAYTTQTSDAGIELHSTVPCNKSAGDEMRWDGTVKGNAISGTMVMKQAGKETRFAFDGKRASPAP
jgi:hypothetical protein